MKKQCGVVPELDLHHGERLGKVEVATSWRNIPSVCSLTVWLLKRVCRARVPPPTRSSYFWLLHWLVCVRKWARLPSEMHVCVPLLAYVHTFMTSCVCGKYTDRRAAPTWLPPLTVCSAQSSPTGPQLAGCGLCVFGVISSAWRLWPGVDKIWIPYWCCYITWRKSTGTMLAQDTSLFLLTQIKPSLPHSLLILCVWYNG